MKRRVAEALRDLITFENRPLKEGLIDDQFKALLAKIK